MTGGAALRPGGSAAKLPTMPRRARMAAALLTIATVAAAVAARSDDPPPRVVRYHNDQLSVRLERVPLDEVLAALGQSSGAEIRGSVREPRDVTAQFDDVALPEALHRLLGDQNFMLKYGEGDRLRVIALLGGPQAVTKTTTPTPIAAPPTTTLAPPPAAGPAGALAMLQNHPPIPISGRLAEALGTPSATFQQLFDAAIRMEDAGVRAEAMRVWLNAFEAEPELRSSVVASLAGMDDAALSNMLRGMAGSRAEEIVSHIATQARATDLRLRASTVLQRLRQPAAPPGG